MGGKKRKPKPDLEDELLILAVRQEKTNQKVNGLKKYMSRKFREILRELRKR